jgi:hypothetical protein
VEPAALRRRHLIWPDLCHNQPRRTLWRRHSVVTAVTPSASGGTAGNDAQLSMACQTEAVATTLKAAVATSEATTVTGTGALVALLQDMDPGE